MDNGTLIVVLALLLALLPIGMALRGSNPAWKILATIFALAAIVAIFGAWFLIAAGLWVVAMIFAGVSHSTREEVPAGSEPPVISGHALGVALIAGLGAYLAYLFAVPM